MLCGDQCFYLFNKDIDCAIMVSFLLASATTAHMFSASVTVIRLDVRSLLYLCHVKENALQVFVFEIQYAEKNSKWYKIIKFLQYVLHHLSWDPVLQFLLILFNCL